MSRTLIFALLPLLSHAFLVAPSAAKAAPLVAKTTAKHVQLSDAQKKTMHWGCVNSCKPQPIESKCITECETAMYKCIDETGPNETPKDTDACQAKVTKLFTETKGVAKKEEKKEAKKEEKKEKPKAFLQVRNIDDDNAEAAEMARLEAQSDKDMGEDDDETKTDDEDKSDDEESFVQTSSKKGDGFDGFGTPDPFNQNDDDQVDAGEPNAPDQENPNDDANMVSDDDADDDDSFVQVGSKVTKKGDGFDGFGTPDPFNQNDDDQVDAGEPNAPDQENPNDDANMVSDDDADDDDSFVQVSRNIDDDNAEAAEMARLEAQSDKDMGEDDDETSKSDDEEEKSDDESFVQVSSKKGDGFDGFGTPDPFNQNDDDQVDAGEPNAPDQENPNDDANMVSDDDADDDDSFIQVSRNIDDDNAEAAEMARLEAQSDKDMGEDDDESKTDDDEEKSDDEESFIQKSKNIDDDNAEAAEMARLEAQSDKDMGEDDDESKTDDDEEKSDDEESFIQKSKNIDDDNAEAAEMARLEAQSDKDMGEDDDESKTDDDEEKSDDESFIQTSKNIDDDNAEAAEMARLEAQSDKDMGEDDDESKTDDDDDEEKSDDEE